jgi:hypothetical protein
VGVPISDTARDRELPAAAAAVNIRLGRRWVDPATLRPLKSTLDRAHRAATPARRTPAPTDRSAMHDSPKTVKPQQKSWTLPTSETTRGAQQPFSMVTP